MMKDKRGISPVIATVLLVTIVVVIAVIFFIALVAFRGSTGTKFNEPIESFCADVDFTVSKSDGDVSINNRGSVGIAQLNIKDSSGDVEECNVGVAPGRSKITSCDASNAESAIPILEGEDEDGNTVYHVCDDVEEFF